MTRSRLIGACALSIAVLVASASMAGAHARYESSTPAKGEVLAASPSSVTVTFTQDVQKITGTFGIGVTNEGGQPVTSGAAVLDDSDRSRMSASLTPALPAGRYVVRWTNVSDEDGDTAEGAFSFYVGREPTDSERTLDAELEGIGAEETPSISPSPTEAAPGPTAAPPDSAADASGGDDGVPTWLIVGGAVLGAAVLVAFGWFAWGLRGH